MPEEALAAIESLTGAVTKTEMLSAGLNSEIAARLHCGNDTIFVKGLRSDHPRVWTQRREADINPYTKGLAPKLLWHIKRDGWDLLGFEDLDGEHVDYSPGSAHLPLVVHALQTLAGVTAPSSVELKTMPSRMSAYVDRDSGDLRLFAGSSLLHTDWKPDNILVKNGEVRLVDWAWASTGAAWIDPALWIIWLIASGHTAEQAEALAREHPAWNHAPIHGINAFARAQQRLWESITRADKPDEWTHTMHDAAAAWAAHRS
jgi:hypothetical protein